MKNYLLIKYLLVFIKKYTFIFFTTVIFLISPFSKSYSEENVFTINNINVEGPINLNFTREKYLNKAFLNSFEVLMNKILLTRDLKRVENIKIKEIKNFISKFKITEESYKKGKYKLKIKIFYNEIKIKKFLRQKNISFSLPENISAIFYPILFINDEIQNLENNFFYKNWKNVEIQNELINFILPLEDLEDVSQIIEMKNKIEELNVNSLVNKYDIKNYVFALMDYKNAKLNIYIKSNFNNVETSKNFSHKLKNINDEILLNFILKDLKKEITDLWKEKNLINLLMPLSINLKFKHKNLKDLDKLKNIFNKISVIDKYVLEEFNITNSFFKIYYYGSPKKLKSELSKFGYQLKNKQGSWHLNLND